MADESRKWKAVYTIVERPEKAALFLRVGTAWPNADGSMNVRLDALPINGMLHVRDYEPTATAAAPKGSRG